MATCQKRLVANPSMGIGDLMKAMTNFLDEQCDLDLHAAVSPPGHNVWSWKTAPNLSWMAKISALATPRPRAFDQEEVAQSWCLDGGIARCSTRKPFPAGLAPKDPKAGTFDYRKNAADPQVLPVPQAK